MNATVGAFQHRLRADASRNRERIMAAARHVLLEAGPDAPLDAIAQRAGVGNATVYRHFADRRELFRQVTLYSMERIAAAADAALDDPAGAFEALSRFIHVAADEHLGSTCSLSGDDFDRNDPPVVAARNRVIHAIEALMSRARDAGELRPDVTIGDLMVAITQLSRPMPGSECAHSERFARRHLQLFIDGLHSPARSSLPGDPVTLEDLERRTT
jgi:AcrR family transcriptional regulator